MDEEFFNWEDMCYGMSEPPKQESSVDKRYINRIIKDEWNPGCYTIMKNDNETINNETEPSELNSFWDQSLDLLGNK